MKFLSLSLSLKKGIPINLKSNHMFISIIFFNANTASIKEGRAGANQAGGRLFHFLEAHFDDFGLLILLKLFCPLNYSVICIKSFQLLIWTFWNQLLSYTLVFVGCYPRGKVEFGVACSKKQTVADH